MSAGFFWIQWPRQRLTWLAEVCVRPGADDSARPMCLATRCEQVIGAFQRDEAARVTGQPEYLARVLDADGVVGGRVQDQQRRRKLLILACR